MATKYPYLPSYIKSEIEYPGEVKKGDRGNKVKRVQEWLAFHSISTAIDSDFGPATKACVEDFQKKKGITQSGKVNKSTWEALLTPMSKAYTAIDFGPNVKANEAVLKVAQQHLKEHPIELGGNNRGPWVRSYVNGNEGNEWAWCAGFASTVMHQAYANLGKSSPIKGSVSCDALAYQAKQKDLFVRGTNLLNGNTGWKDMGKCGFFLNLKVTNDWNHTGFYHAGEGEVFKTIEGNTNDNGSREGFEVCARRRSVNSKRDFILLPD